MDQIRDENADQNEELKINDLKVRLKSKSKSTSKIANYEELKQNISNRRRQRNIFDQNKELEKSKDSSKHYFNYRYF